MVSSAGYDQIYKSLNAERAKLFKFYSIYQHFEVN